MRNHRLITLLLVAASFASAGTALAAKGGNPHTPIITPACSISGSSVNATGLPTDQVINFMFSDSSGTHGFVLGFTHDGSWAVNVPAPNGSTTYEFVSRTYGPDGSKYDIFQSCSV